MSALFRTQLQIARAITAVTLRRARKGPRHPRWRLPFEIGVEVCGQELDLDDAGNGALEFPGRHGAIGIPLAYRARVRHSTGQLAELPTEVHTPRGVPDDGGVGGAARTLLYFHGGGYITCSPATHRALASRLAVATGARTILPNYRKAPEHPFPAAIDDAESTYRALIEQGVDPGGLFVGGDSAGGGLVMALIQRVRAQSLPLPRGLVLLSPWVDMTAVSGSMLDNRRYDYINFEHHQRIAELYLAGADPTDPLVSAVNADLAGFPDILMLTGALELFLDQNVALAERASGSGVQVNHIIAPHMVHVYPLLAEVSATARADIERIGAFVRG